MPVLQATQLSHGTEHVDRNFKGALDTKQRILRILMQLTITGMNQSPKNPALPKEFKTDVKVNRF